MTTTETAWRSRIVRHSKRSPASLRANPRNYRTHPPEQRAAMAEMLDRVGWVQDIVLNVTSGNLVDGHLRLDLALERGEKAVPVIEVELSEEEEALVLASLDPLAAMATVDTGALTALLAGLDRGTGGLAAMLADLAARSGIELPGPADGAAAAVEEARRSLAERFLVPPFSVLDARQGYWQERKRAWLALGIQSELGRGADLIAYSEGAASHYAAPGGSPRPAASLGPDGRTQRGDGRGVAMRKPPETASLAGGLTHGTTIHPHDAVGKKRNDAALSARPPHGPTVRQNPDGSLNYQPTNNGEGQSGTSVFDPVLCELAYRWFSPPDGAVLDPFAGGSVRGIVASHLGRRYTGVDLSERQLAANRQQAAAIVPDAPPRWIGGDSADIAALAPGEYDLVFSCPPYADLEVYSDDPRDISTMPYDAFLAAYRGIIAASVGMLRPDRFACVVVGDIRDRRGLYRNFVAHTIEAFQDAGAMLYNDAVLVTAVGSLSIRVGRQFSASRKLGKAHQNVLVFCKGDAARATAACGPVEVPDLAEMFGEVLLA